MTDSNVCTLDFAQKNLEIVEAVTGVEGDVAFLEGWLYVCPCCGVEFFVESPNRDRDQLRALESAQARHR